MYHKMQRVIEVKDFDECKFALGEEWKNVSKSDIEYGKIPITYDNRQFLLRVPKCKTTGIQIKEMDNGYIRRTMPIVFDDPLTFEQSEFVNVFQNIARVVYERMTHNGYPDSKLSKLDSCIWRDKVLYTSIIESVYDFKNNSRYFIGDEEVGKDKVEGKAFEANAAVLIDSIYVGERTVSIQVKLYEVSLTPSKKRDRVL